MHKGQYIFYQLTFLISRYQFQKCVDHYGGDKKVRNFKCWQQFLCMSFGQLTDRDSLRNIVLCLNAQSEKLYNLGLPSKIALSTLAEANEKRSWKIYKNFATILISEARRLYVDDKDFCFDLDHAVYALDASTIDLCLTVFKWAKFRDTKAAIKLHTAIDLRGNIPTFVHITDGKVHDVKALDVLEIEIGAFYIMDRGYLDFERLYKIHTTPAFFITRAKKNTQMKRLYSKEVDKSTGLRCDQVVVLTGFYASKNYSEKLRRIKYHDENTGNYYVFITNNFDIDAKLVADLYKARWEIELFFKWIKQHLKVKVFWGYSENAVRTQIWIAVCTYLLVAIAKKRLKLDQSLNEILQILSVSLFDKTPLNQLFQRADYKEIVAGPPEQLNLPGF